MCVCVSARHMGVWVCERAREPIRLLAEPLFCDFWIVVTHFLLLVDGFFFQFGDSNYFRLCANVRGRNMNNNNNKCFICMFCCCFFGHISSGRSFHVPLSSGSGEVQSFRFSIFYVLMRFRILVESGPIMFQTKNNSKQFGRTSGVWWSWWRITVV